MQSNTRLQILATVVPALLLGLDGTFAHAQPTAVTAAPSAPALRSTPIDLDERELEQAIIEGRSQGQGPPTQWAIAPPPAAIPQPAPGSFPAPITAVAPTPASPPPAAHHSSTTIPHISGGVGYDERARLGAVKSQYNLHLLFAITGDGSYLSGVKVLIQDSQGNSLLETVSNGPWFFAQLAPGTYTLTLDNQGQVQKRSIRIVPQRATEANIFWTATPQDTQVDQPGWNYPLPSGSPAQGMGGYGGPSPVAQPLSPRLTPTGIPYLSGGNTPEERARLEASQIQFNLRLNFEVQNAGDRPLSILVRIQDLERRVTLVETTANGPIFMAQLPAGYYLVTLNHSGQEIQREMSVPGYGMASASFQWTY